MFGGLDVIYSATACTIVPRSDRKTLRAKRPTYGKHRKRAFSGLPRKVAVIRSSRRCAPRVWAKPGAFRMGNRLIVHPALRSALMSAIQ